MAINPLFISAVVGYVRRITPRISMFCKQEFELPGFLNPKHFLRFEFGESLSQIREGEPLIQYGFGRMLMDLTWSEFEPYNDDEVIGSHYCKGWQEYVRIVACHEFAHLVHDFRYGTKRGEDDDEDHDVRFQDIYRVIRKRFQNDETDVAITKTVY